MAQLPPANRKSTVVGEYVLGEEIGKGAHGVVYKAISVLTGAVVAVKEISVRGLDETASTALTLEIELLKSLQHENVVRLIGVVKHAAYVYVILEFIENGSLSSLIKPQKFGVMSEQLAKVYVKQVLAGLSFCHANGVVHRDVKGGNILTTKNGVVKICDFGVAMRVDKNGGTGSDIKSKQSSDNKHSKDTGKQSTEKHKNQPVKELDAQGTPYWMAPEVIEMGGAGPASDVWSVGCVVCELLTGAPPYFELAPMPAMFAIVQSTKTPPAVRSLGESFGYSAELTDFLLLCFRKDPSKRPSAHALMGHAWLVGEASVKINPKNPVKKKGNENPPISNGLELDALQSDGESSESSETEEWTPPDFQQDARRRNGKNIPPSSPFQDAPAETFAFLPKKSKPELEPKHELEPKLPATRVGSPDLGNLLWLETHTVMLTNELTQHVKGAAVRMTRFYGTVLENSEVGFRSDEFVDTKKAKESFEFRYSPASCDAALVEASTADAIVSRLGLAPASETDIADLMDLCSVLIAATTTNNKTNKTRTKTVGKFTAGFCLLGGVRLTLDALGNCTGDDPASALTRTSCALVVARIVNRKDGVAARVVVACGGLVALTKTLTSPKMGYRGYNRVTIRAVLDGIFGVCFPGDTRFRNWQESSVGGGKSISRVWANSVEIWESDANAEKEVRRVPDFHEKNEQRDDDESSFGFDQTVRDSSSDGVSSAVVQSGAPARAGLAPALAKLLAQLNVAAREEAGTTNGGISANSNTGGTGKQSKNSAASPSSSPPASDLETVDATSLTPSGKARDACVEALAILLLAPGFAGRAARVSLFAQNVQATHAFVGLVGSPGLPTHMANSLLRIVRFASRDPIVAAGLRNAGATPKLTRCLQSKNAHSRESALRALRNACLLGDENGATQTAPCATALEHAVIAGCVPHLIAIVCGDDTRFLPGDTNTVPGDIPKPKTDGGGVGFGIANGANGDAAHWRRFGGDGVSGCINSSLQKVATDLLCAAASNGSRVCRVKLLEQNALDALVGLAFPRTTTKGVFGVAQGSRLGNSPAQVSASHQKESTSSLAAIHALHAWLLDEPWAVEARLMDRLVVEAAVNCVVSVSLGGDAGGRRDVNRKNTRWHAAIDAAAVAAFAGFVTDSTRWAGALVSGGLVESTLSGLEHVLTICEDVFASSGKGDRSSRAKKEHELVLFVTGVVTSRVSLLHATGETDPKAKEWIRQTDVVERVAEIGKRLGRIPGDGVGKAVDAVRECGERLRRRR